MSFTISFFKTNSQPLSFVQRNGHVEMSERPIKEYDTASLQTFLVILQVCWYCLAGREKQSDKFVGHVGEGLHLFSVGL